MPVKLSTVLKLKEAVAIERGELVAERRARIIALETVMLASQYVPRDTGALAASLFMRKRGKEWLVGFDSPYSGIVHAMPQRMLKNGKSRFLARAFEEAVAKSGQRREHF